MSTSAPRYHIPFPKTFLSLNAKPSKLPSTGMSIVTAPTIEPPTHNFLSNKPAARHFSMSSTTSTASTASSVSEPSSPASKAVDAAQMNGVPAFRNWLTLNAKFNGPTTGMSTDITSRQK
ncbi:hypothetical protein BCR34DRAFT_320778 [Clohesyomyces aquaticus]|uniref:Uncharacterized protein n=1 Tax=Clohesyomyces aquaticus TaxID=1231657 RepID=A0A1Y2A8C3_9PLEO|nr:hypothetical protein BCR34DRAFT_320778 [Clohesyomyces aquaticus]